MMRFLLYILLTISTANAGQLKIAVVDTGLDITNQKYKKYLCPTGHMDFTGEGFTDYIGHGTHIFNTIVENANSRNYCIIIYKVFSKLLDGEVQVRNIELSYLYAKQYNVKIINLSLTGSYSYNEENFVINNPNILFVVAAGNENKNIDIDPVFPASLPEKNVITVGSITRNGGKSRSSNYGKQVDVWEIGDNVEAECKDGNRCRMSGTSQATALYTARIIREGKYESH